MNLKHQWLVPLSFAVLFGCSEPPKEASAPANEPPEEAITGEAPTAQAEPEAQAEPASEKVVETATPANTVVFGCGDKEFTVKFEGEMADVLLGERTIILSRIRTASGIKFQEVNGSNSLWSHGDKTTIEVDGDVYQCTKK